MKRELKPDTLIPAAQAKLEELNLLLKQIQAEQNGLPEGKLSYSSWKNTAQYYYISPSDKKRKYLSKTKKDGLSLITKLAQKDYNSRFMKTIKKQISALNNFLENYKPAESKQVFLKLNKKQKPFVTNYTLSQEEYTNRWLSTPYEPKPFKTDTPKHFTTQGLQVRSKSEVLIAEFLYKNKIPFKYEQPLILNGTEIIHPDFTCLNPRTRKEYIWEHLGMMDNTDYLNKTLTRLELYNQNGYFQGKNLLTTMESPQHPLNAKIINRIIKEYLA